MKEKQSPSMQSTSADETTDDENPVAATKLGKFNILLFLISVPSGWSTLFETTTMSYVCPVAECDLDLSLARKGTLNAMCFAGMVCSGIIWGFLSDTLGRRKVLLMGHFLDGIIVILSSLSQNLEFLIVTKFFGGLIVNGCFASLAAYVGEFHCSKYRTRVQILRGITLGSGPIVLPLIAWAIMPLKIHLTLFRGAMVFHAWNLFLLISSLPSLLSGVIFSFMPESPKFLMTTGKNEEALEVFRLIYSINTGHAKESFVIKQLVEETKLEHPQNNRYGGRVTANRNKKQALKEGLQQIKPLFFPPHARNAALVCLIAGMVMCSHNTLRLWLPQLYQSFIEYELRYNRTASLCVMMVTMEPQERNSTDCAFHFSSSVYINTLSIASLVLLVYAVSGGVYSKLLGKKWSLATAGFIAACSAFSLYFSHNAIMTLILSAIFLSQTALSQTLVITVTIDLFPTTLRSVAVALLMTIGRIGAMAGNFLFPVMLSIGCEGPFFFLGCLVIVAMVVETFLPNTEKKALQ